MDINPAQAVLAARPSCGTPCFAVEAFAASHDPISIGPLPTPSRRARLHRVPRLRRLHPWCRPRGNPETVRSWTSVISVNLLLPLKRLLALLRPTSPHLLRLSPFVAKPLRRQKSSALDLLTNLRSRRLRVYRHLSPTLLTSTPTLQLRVPSLTGQLKRRVGARQMTEAVPTGFAASHRSPALSGNAP
jgi:hypothetical protein